MTEPQVTLGGEPAISFGPFRLLTAQRLLLEGDRPVRLGGRAFDILAALVERAGEIFRLDAAGAGQVKTSVPLLEGAQIKGLSGMTCVLPAWSILEVLNDPELLRVRDESEREMEARPAREGKTPPIPEG